MIISRWENVHSAAKTAGTSGDMRREAAEPKNSKKTMLSHTLLGHTLTEMPPV